MRDRMLVRPMVLSALLVLLLCSGGAQTITLPVTPINGSTQTEAYAIEAMVVSYTKGITRDVESLRLTSDALAALCNEAFQPLEIVDRVLRFEGVSTYRYEAISTSSMSANVWARLPVIVRTNSRLILVVGERTVSSKKEFDCLAPATSERFYSGISDAKKIIATGESVADVLMIHPNVIFESAQFGSVTYTTLTDALSSEKPIPPDWAETVKSSAPYARGKFASFDHFLLSVGSSSKGTYTSVLGPYQRN